MYELRLLFEKRGSARYMSHLDLMQVFRRAFNRAGVRLSYSKGFHPHASINILLPLATGFESGCELMDIGLVADRVPDGFIFDLNRALPSGVVVKGIAPAERPVKQLAFVEYEIEMEAAVSAAEAAELFHRDSLLLMKRSKRGESEVDIIKLIKRLDFEEGDGALCADALLMTGENTLNPEYIVTAIAKYLGREPSYAIYSRREVYDAEMKPFR